jgi:hypothetical protein
MRCLDNIDLAAMAGALTVMAGAAVIVAYLGLERAPLTIPEPISPAAMIEHELTETIAEATLTPARMTAEREFTQATLGEAVRDLSLIKMRSTGFFRDLAGLAAQERVARREFLEGVFKLPADWQGAEFRAMERAAEATAQERLGRTIVSGSQALERASQTAEERYGRALIAAIGAREREAGEPFASRSTMVATAAAMKAFAERKVAAPPVEIAREPSWGFGSIGDGAPVALFALGGGALVLLAAGIGLMREHGVSTRTVDLHCDVHHKDVRVEVLLSDDRPYDIARCSAFNGGPVTCDKHCLGLEPLMAKAA